MKVSRTNTSPLKKSRQEKSLNPQFTTLSSDCQKKTTLKFQSARRLMAPRRRVSNSDAEVFEFKETVKEKH